MLGLYIHIPFCLKKCPYCDFNSYAGKYELAEDYFAALTKHLETFSGKRIDTVYIGGGTPTSTDPMLIAKLMNSVYTCFDIDLDAEITIEANPATLTPENLDIYRNCGINRISIGVQSFSDITLKTLGRIHSAAEAKEAVLAASAAGFENISIDLMFSTPGQSFSLWSSDLSYAMTMPINHISCYGLKIEPGTPFSKDNVKPLSDEDDRRFYHYAVDFLQRHGFMQYEISNFASDGNISRHNMLYWKCENYIGIGAGAHSYIGDVRFSNTKSIEQYILNVNHGITMQENTVTLSPCDKNTEKLIMGMRLRRGVSLETALAATTRIKLDKYIRQGFIEEKDGRIMFTTNGFDVSNYILSDLI